MRKRRPMEEVLREIRENYAKEELARQQRIELLDDKVDFPKKRSDWGANDVTLER
jgi:hypothetical protein